YQLHRISGDVNAPNECEAESTNPCVNKAKALPLKIISIVAILLTSMIGVSAPLFSRDTPEISDPSMGTSFMHVLPDSFQMLSSECLEDDPWQKFPFTGFVAMLSVTSHSAIMATSFYSSKTGSEIVPAAGNGDQERANPIIAHGHSHRHGVTLTTKDDSGSQLLGYRANGIALSSIYRDNSPAALITVGLFNACSLHGPRQPSSSRVHGTKAPR
uniref:Uncharacterized protein n=1 Tax=Brassica oleracea var. oleracea TaxID=109376 RepID=A0A0D3E6I5_BRAOL